MAAAIEGPELFAFGPFVLDLDRGALLRDGIELHLRPKSFEVLRHLVARSGRLVSREELLRAVWPGLIVTDDSLTQCLIDIRKALDDDRHRIIRTVPRKGYIFDVPVERRAPEDDTGSLPTITETGDPARPARRYLGALAILAVLAAVSGLWYLDTFRPVEQTEEFPFDPPPRSVAVLPFSDLSPAGDREYLAEGISEEILNALTQIRDLTVIARTSSFAFKGSGSSIADIARRLNVAYVLEGSVRTEGDTARVTAQLVSAEKEAHLWSRTFDLPLGSAFDIQGKVADELAGLMSRDIGVEMPEPAAGANRYVPDPRAWDHVLRGRFFHGRRGEGDLERALREFDAAIDADPELADAWAGRAGALYVLGVTGVGGYDRHDPAIRAALERALELDETNPETLMRMAEVEWAANNLESSWHYFDQAIARGHNSPFVQGMLAGVALSALELERAVALQQRAAALDPLSFVTWGNLAQFLCIAGHFKEAEAAALRAQDIRQDAGTTAILTKIALLREDYAAAGSLAAQLPEGVRRDWAWTLLHHLAGDPAQSDRALARLQRYSDAEATMHLAMAHAVRGETEAAFRAIEAATDTVFAEPRETMEWPLLIEIRTSTFLAPLHADPRWSDWIGETWRRLNEVSEWDPAEVFRRYPDLGVE